MKGLLFAACLAVLGTLFLDTGQASASEPLENLYYVSAPVPALLVAPATYSAPGCANGSCSLAADAPIRRFVARPASRIIQAKPVRKVGRAVAAPFRLLFRRCN